MGEVITLHRQQAGTYEVAAREGSVELRLHQGVEVVVLSMTTAQARWLADDLSEAAADSDRRPGVIG